MNRVTFRFYGPLNDFLRSDQRQVAFSISFTGRRSVKDAVESVGVPHPEIDLILLNGETARFDTTVGDGARIAAFPRFYTIDISGTHHVRPHRPEAVRFALDGHLGKLARRLRLLGIDALCPAACDDDALATMAARDTRILLTRDRELLKRRAIAHGYFIRETEPHRQVFEVLQRYGPVDVEPFSRCIRCNGELRDVAKRIVEPILPPRTRDHYEQFRMCRECGRVYWQGSHWPRLQRIVDDARDASSFRAR
jgi:uncharacterized protein with PIN domain